MHAFLSALDDAWAKVVGDSFQVDAPPPGQTPEQRARLEASFPTGVCDWTKPGVSQQPMTDSWLRFMPEAGTWTQMGHSSFGNN